MWGAGGGDEPQVLQGEVEDGGAGAVQAAGSSQGRGGRPEETLVTVGGRDFLGQGEPGAWGRETHRQGVLDQEVFHQTAVLF